MKLFSLIIIAIVLNVSFAKGSPSFVANPVDTVLEKAKKLHVLYLRATTVKQPDVKTKFYERQFFTEFPNNFKLFNTLYGTTKGKPGYLNEVAEKHLDLFNGLTNIVDSVYYKKLIILASEGVWDIDAVSYLQNGLKTRFLRNPDLVMSILKKMPPKKIRNFWYFFFDCLYPERDIPDYVKKVTIENEAIFKLMVDAHAAVVKARESDDNPIGEK